MSATLREPVSKVDNAWWHMDTPDNRMVVTSVLLFDRPLDPAAVRDLVEQRMLRFARFRQRIVTPLRDLGEPQWELDPDFDLDAHLHRVALPAPGGEEELRAMVSDVMSRPLDAAKPLWETWIVDGHNGGGALISRTHHCVADGIALTRLLLSLTDKDAADAPDGEPEWWEVRPRRLAGAPKRRGALGMAAHLTGIAAREVLSSVRDPAHASRVLREARDDLAALTRVTFLPAEARTSLKGHLGVRKVVTWSGLIPLAEVKRIATTVEGTVNDVLVSAVAGGLRRYLLDRGDRVPESLELHATVPVNLRPLDGPIELGNRFGLVYPALPVGIADPLQRLRAVKDNLDQIKDTPEATVAIAVLDALGHGPAALERRFIEFFTSKSSMVLTNVPGPRHHRRFAGARLERVVSWAPPSGSLAMSLCIFSYAGDITIGLQTDAGTIPEPQAIVDAVQAELAELGSTDARAERTLSGRRAPTRFRRESPTTSSPGRPARSPSHATRPAG
jgi:WS/DGAT/MGAT family acyltransferase